MNKPFELRGKVVRGSGLGRRLGFPTANVAVPRRSLPPFGVYRAQARWDDGALRPAVCNVGVRPTLGSSGEVWVEVHILNFYGDIYGKELRVCCEEKIRDERRFDSLDRLADQIRRDVEAVRAECLRGGRGKGTERRRGETA